MKWIFFLSLDSSVRVESLFCSVSIILKFQRTTQQISSSFFHFFLTNCERSPLIRNHGHEQKESKQFSSIKKSLLTILRRRRERKKNCWTVGKHSEMAFPSSRLFLYLLRLYFYRFGTRF